MSVPAQTQLASADESYQYQWSPVVPIVPDIAAYIVIDEATGEVVLEHNPDTILPMASVAKLLVAGAAYRSPLLSATTTITTADTATPEAFGNLAAGQIYTLRELLFPYLLESSNDAGAALERTWGSELGSEIAVLLAQTDTATQVTFGDYTGLAATTAGSARALATLTRAIARSTPQIFDITQLPRYVGSTTTLVNNSPVYLLEDYQGGKHGYTEAAGKTLVARMNTPFADGERTLVYVMLGGVSHRAGLAALTTTIADHVDRVPHTTPASAILSAPSNE